MLNGTNLRAIWVRSRGSGMKILRSIYIDIEQLEKLDSLSVKTRVPKATYIREALELVLEKYERQIKSTQKRKEEA